MTPPIAFFCVVPALVLAGCASSPQQRQDYSPGYNYVSTDAGGSEKGIGGSVLAPDACLAEPADDDNSAAKTNLTIVSGVGSHLPPGCANAFNLQRMSESQRDLVEGRRMGPAAGGGGGGRRPAPPPPRRAAPPGAGARPPRARPPPPP
ncbi:hypothetical protein NKH48_28575, partial [Mesorhizobium sp. M1233]|uniref:hypothetical protein n=1 Tax=Mesorhizobium sp. M1233 TaxID=2957072 RepID=UPI00333C8120